MKPSTQAPRRRGAIIQRGKERFLVRVYVGRDPTGKRVYRSEMVNGPRSTATRALTALLSKLDMGGLNHDQTTWTVREYLTYWLETSARPRLAKSTFAHYQQMLDDYVNPVVGNRRLAKLALADIQVLYGQLLERGLSARTVRYCHAVLSSALKQAVRWRFLTTNPASLVDLPKQRPREMLAPTREEATHLLDVSRRTSHHALFSLLLLTGMRTSEARGLLWGDIDFARGAIHVQRVVRDVPGGWQFAAPKTRRSRRRIALPDELVKILLAHRDVQDDDRQGVTDLVFSTATGQPLSHSNIFNRHFKRLALEARLPEGFRMHDLRHTHASLLLQAGIHPKIVSERLGHSSITLTLDTYSHVLPGLQAESAERLNELLFPTAHHDPTRSAS